MAKKIAITSLDPQERLYRLLWPELWSPAKGDIDPAAFRDDEKNHPSLSVYLASIATPTSILSIFCKYRFFKTKYNYPTPIQLWEHGVGIGCFSVHVINELGLDFVRHDDGSIKVNPKGHAEIYGGQRFAADLARSAKALTKECIFRNIP